MKIHPHWKLFALALQVAGWNHGEWVLRLVEKYGDKDPFIFPLAQMVLSDESLHQTAYWSEKWQLFIQQSGTSNWEELAEHWSAWAQKNHWHWVVPWETEYPEVFKDESDFPAVIWSSQVLSKRKDQMRVAVVGSREASAYGMFACASLVKELVESYRCAIVSGCARGIDTSAHKQTIRSGGYTYGFVACGAAFIPNWQKEMFATGCLVSIFAPNARAQKWHFSQRNIYISRWSQGVLVVEASPKSGTLLTAHSALEQGRPLAVVTHPIFAPHWSGVRSLIEMGAQVVSTGKECIEVFAPQNSEGLVKNSTRTEVLELAADEEERELLSTLLEQGGVMLEHEFPEFSQQQKKVSSLVERGVIVRQAGVVLLSCMIQS